MQVLHLKQLLQVVVVIIKCAQHCAPKELKCEMAP